MFNQKDKLMRKRVLFSLGLLSAVSTFATVKTVTLPAVPKGHNCSFVIQDIPGNLDLDGIQNDILHSLVGSTYEKDTTIYFNSYHSTNDTLKCEISIGRKASLVVNDTILCAEDSTFFGSLIKLNSGSYWKKDLYSDAYYEYRPNYDDIHAMKIKIPDSIPLDSIYSIPLDSIYYLPIDSTRHDSTFYYPGSRIDYYPNFVHTFDNVNQTGFYTFVARDTFTGCIHREIAKITVNKCNISYIHWYNYDGPKEYHAYRSDDYLSYLKEDSIYVLDPFVNCICKLPLDTIVESTQSENPEDCDYYKYDVTVKLVATIHDPKGIVESDTIVAYVLHLNDSGSSFEIAPDTAIATFNGNCVFTVPEIFLAIPKCDCGSYYYTQNLHTGDTITKSCDVIFTFRNYCNGDTIRKMRVLVPEGVEILGKDTTVYAKDSIALRRIIYINSIIPVYNNWINEINMVNSSNNITKAYFNSIAEENLVLRTGGNEMPTLYFLDNVKKTGTYYFVVRDTMTGCEATKDIVITVLGNDSTPASLYPADIYEVKGNIYTISGAVVMKDVYLKDGKDILKEGLYIFNNRKIYIKRKD